jgi:chromate transporter
MIVIYLIARILTKWHENQYIKRILAAVRPAVLALILYAGWQIGKLSLTEWRTQLLAGIMLAISCLKPKSPILYIAIGAVAGVLFEL